MGGNVLNSAKEERHFLHRLAPNEFICGSSSWKKPGAKINDAVNDTSVVWKLYRVECTICMYQQSDSSSYTDSLCDISMNHDPESDVSVNYYPESKSVVVVHITHSGECRYTM